MKRQISKSCVIIQRTKEGKVLKVLKNVRGNCSTLFKISLNKKCSCIVGITDVTLLHDFRYFSLVIVLGTPSRDSYAYRSKKDNSLESSTQKRESSSIPVDSPVLQV